MKRRIGTKLYDTETAITVLPEMNLYRAQKNQTYFLFDGAEITPIDYQEAQKMIVQSGNEELMKLLSKTPNSKGQCAIMVSASAADHLSAYCREQNVTQKKVIENFIFSLQVTKS